MISLDVKDYCANCPDFEPDVDKDILKYENFGCSEVIMEVNTTISCKYKHKCECIKEFLENERIKMMSLDGGMKND